MFVRYKNEVLELKSKGNQAVVNNGQKDIELPVYHQNKSLLIDLARLFLWRVEQLTSDEPEEIELEIY